MTFEENIHKAVWGEEAWLVSAHHTSPSRLTGEDRTLADVCPDFPLLVKKIRADQRLSVQVHPNDVTARTVGGEAKTEMWCVLKAGPIFAGLRRGTTPDDVRRAAEDGSFVRLLMRYDAQEGDCYFIPGGLVHAIGDGTTVYEVQQSSNTTFRLYDWGRTGADGKPRPLHVKEGLAAMDLTLLPPVPVREVHCPYFDFTQIPARTPLGRSASWRILYAPASGVSQLLPPGETVEVTEYSFLTVVK